MSELVSQLNLLGDPEPWRWDVGKPRPLRVSVNIGDGCTDAYLAYPRVDSVECQLTAIHECGHALAAFLMDVEVCCVSMDPRHSHDRATLGSVRHGCVPRDFVALFNDFQSFSDTPMAQALVGSDLAKCDDLKWWMRCRMPVITAAGIAAELLNSELSRWDARHRFTSRRLKSQFDGDTAKLLLFKDLSPESWVYEAVWLLRPWLPQLRQLAQLVNAKRTVSGPEFEQACRLLGITAPD